ncbi:hypothetical protein TruAng_000449 [Truncatella angustata]|nr:hypothetical protein TruAng_000449 [Truncatella angustata]
MSALSLNAQIAIVSRKVRLRREDAQMPAPAAHHAGSYGCCCNHGGRCTCSCKKEPALDTVPESESDQDQEPVLHSKARAAGRRRSRANTTHSEPVLSFDENGHHKPAHKNKVSQKCGPYTLSRGHSMHSISSTSSMGNRSVDNLHKAPTRSRSKDLIAQDLDSRKAKSEQASPLISGNSAFQHLNGQLPPLDLSSIQYPEYPGSFDLFHGIDEQPVFSAGLSAPSVDWAQYDGLDMKADNFAPSSYDQAQSYSAAFDFSTEPTLTSNSGDVSETEDFVGPFSEAQIEGFRLSAATNYMSLQQQSQSAAALGDFSSGDFGSFKAAAAANKFLPNLGSLDETNGEFPLLEEDTYWSMNNFTDGITQSPDPVAATFWDNNTQ